MRKGRHGSLFRENFSVYLSTGLINKTISGIKIFEHEFRHGYFVCGFCTSGGIFYGHRINICVQIICARGRGYNNFGSLT